MVFSAPGSVENGVAMKVSFEGARVTIDGKSHQLEYRIDSILVLPDHVIVVFHSESMSEADPNYDRNVIALDRNGKMLWRIQRAIGEMHHEGKIYLSPYIGVQWFGDQRRRVVAVELRGFTHDLDVETGKISNTLFTK